MIVKLTTVTIFFKIDNQLLKDKYFVNIIKKTIRDTAIEYHNFNPQLKWEIIKVEIRQKSEQYSKTYKRQQKFLKETNKNKLEYYERE